MTCVPTQGMWQRKGRYIEERGNKRMFSAIKPFTSPRIIVYVFFGDLVFDMLSKPQSQ